MARRILVVEDEAPIREMVCFVLEQNGFQPIEAEDYDSAVNQLNEPWPDLRLKVCNAASLCVRFMTDL